MRKLASIVAVSLLLTGCILNNWTTGYPTGYPKGWPPVPGQPEGCPNITGTYRDMGVQGHLDPKYYPGENLTEPLAERFFPESVTTKGRKVHISRPDTDRFIVEVLEQDKPVSSGSFSIASGDVTCDAGWARLRPKIEKGADGTGGYRNKKRIGLAKAVDGSLISKEDTSGIGALIWIIPVVGSQTLWYRWQPIH